MSSRAGYSQRDYKRIRKKLYTFFKSLGSIEYGSVEELCWLLNEPNSSKVKLALQQLCNEGLIIILENSDGKYLMDFHTFMIDRRTL